MSNPLPRLCIVTPSYNTGRYIGAAVQSVLDQDCPNVDYIVLDGGSTDKTVEVLKSFGPRLRWISEKDGGQSDAIKRGYAMTGQGDPDEILGWLNSDDTYAPGAFREVAQYFADHPEIDLLYGDATYTDWDGKHIADCVHIEPYSLHRLCRYSDFMVQPATFVRRRAYEAVGGVDAAIHWAMDYDLWLRIAVKGFKVAYLPKVLAHFRWLAENKTATGGWGRLNEIVEILKRVGFGPTAYIRLEMCNMHARESIQALGSGKVGTSIHAAAKVAGTLLASPRAVGSLFSPHTWRIMWVGQVLRARAAAEQQSHLTPPITASGQAGA